MRVRERGRPRKYRREDLDLGTCADGGTIYRNGELGEEQVREAKGSEQ